GVADLILRSGHLVGGENRSYAWHGERRARVDALDARVRKRAEEQLRKQHPLGAEVLRVLRAAGDLRPELRRRVVLSDPFLVSHAHTSYKTSLLHERDAANGFRPDDLIDEEQISEKRAEMDRRVEIVDQLRADRGLRQHEANRGTGIAGIPPQHRDERVVLL